MHIIDLGLVDYYAALDEQRRVHAKVVSGGLPAAVIICRHNAVITVGRSAHPENLLVSASDYSDRDIEVIGSERGGDVTYHGPGQLIAYPIFPMGAFDRDLHVYLRFLEDAVIRTLEASGIAAQRKSGLTGVWVGEKKIASIGIAVKHWVSYHGLSIVVKHKELENFSLIRPCGLDVAMTSIESELCRPVTFDEVTHHLLRSLSYDQCIAAVAR